MEGTNTYDSSRPIAFTPLTAPIFDYDHAASEPINGKTIIGGTVYRGSGMLLYQGHYFFADYIARRLYSCQLTINPTTHEAAPLTAAQIVDHTSEVGAGTLGGVTSIDVDSQ